MGRQAVAVLKFVWPAAVVLTAGLALAGCDQKSGQSAGDAESTPSSAGVRSTNPDCKDPPIASPVLDNFATSVVSYGRSGGNLDQSDCAGNSLVFLATGPRGGPSVLRALVNGGADPNAPGSDGTPPLVNAAAHCVADSVRILIEAGVDPNAAGPDGRTARDAACTAASGDKDAVLAALDATPTSE
jgi:ankyrin repeat protein